MVSTSSPTNQIEDLHDLEEEAKLANLNHDYWQNIEETILSQRFQLQITLNDFNDASKAELKSAFASVKSDIYMGVDRMWEFLSEHINQGEVLHNNESNVDHCCEVLCSQGPPSKVESERNAIKAFLQVTNDYLKPLYDKAITANVDLLTKSIDPQDEHEFYWWMFKSFWTRLHALFQFSS